MKKRPPLSRKQLLAACLLLLVFALLVCFLFQHFREKYAFQGFSQQLFQKEMTSSTINLHYSLADPEAFGISAPPAALPCYQPGSAGDNSSLQETLLQLTALPRNTLSFEDRYSCSLLERSLQLSLKLSAFPWYADPLSPSQGVQTQLPILLSEYTFRDRKDPDDYLSLLAQTGEYYSSLLLYEQEKAQAGLLPSASCLEQSACQCDTIVTLNELRAGTHFLQTSFQERLSLLSEKYPLSPQEQKDYTARNNTLLIKVFLPACENLARGLRQLETCAPDITRGLACLPEGRDYYQLLLQEETGSSRNPEEIRSLLQETLQQEYKTIHALVQDYPGCLPALEENTYTVLGFDDEACILNDLKTRIAQDFPPLKEGEAWPAVTLKSIAENMQEYSAPAFYLTSPIDDTDTNVIYINHKKTVPELELYTTLSHEGFPGHLYQNAYTANRLLSLKNSHLRQLISYGGYVEGWALYVEQRSYDYASQYLMSKNRAVDAVCVQIEKHNRSLQLCLYSLLDIMIHYDGAELTDIYDYLENYGITSRNTVALIYSYICQSPCNYLKYYLGYLEILDLKQQAVDLWQENYSDLNFHRFYLDWGPADFMSLQEILTRYHPHRP